MRLSRDPVATAHPALEPEPPRAGARRTSTPPMQRHNRNKSQCEERLQYLAGCPRGSRWKAPRGTLSIGSSVDLLPRRVRFEQVCPYRSASLEEVGAHCSRLRSDQLGDFDGVVSLKVHEVEYLALAWRE